MSDLREAARDAYLRALAVIDPIRLHFWDSRGATMTQLRVMHLIRQLGEPSTGEIAEVLGVRPATLTGLADRMEQRGFIRRWADAADRRVVRLALTDEGAMLLDELFSTGEVYLSAIFDRMGAEALQEFSRALRTFIDTAESMRGEPGALPVEARPADERAG